MCYHPLEYGERGETMSNKKRGLWMILTLILSAVLVTACTQSLSQAPAATPTLIGTGLFVSPFPSVENPMAMIEEFAKQTAAAQTVAAGGPSPTAGTPQAIVTGTVITAQVSGTGTATQTLAGGTPTNANSVGTTVVITVAPSGPTSTPIPPGVRPASYTLQSGEFPYCIARRFDVNPDDLLTINGLSSGNLFMPGVTLKIPQSGNFPADRALAAHPTNYTVSSSDETIFSVACRYGDVDPAVLASTNGLSTSADLTVGQQLKIP
jgi:LysM repeat protein